MGITHSTRIAAALAVSLIGLTSCGNVDKYDFQGSSGATLNIPQGDPRPGHNEFNPPAVSGQTKVDMVFIVDNSGSMTEEQQVLADSFNQFINQFVLRDVDFHIGVVTTDVVRGSQGCLVSKSNERFLTNNSNDLIDQFRDNVRVGVTGDGREQGLNSLSMVLSSNRLSGCNSGFLRNDALLWAGVISDENEEITNGETPRQRVDRITSLLNTVKGPDSRGWKMDFIVNSLVPKPAAPLVYPLGNNVNPYPEVYLMAADLMKGKKINIQQNFSQELVAIGGDIIRQAQSEFRLSQVPIAGTLVVRLNGNTLSQSASNGFIYHADRNTIELTGAALAQSPGGKIVVDYLFL